MNTSKTSNILSFGFLAVSVCMLSSLAFANRTIHGYIEDADGRSLPGMRVRAFDRDSFGESDTLISSDADDPIGTQERWPVRCRPVIPPMEVLIF